MASVNELEITFALALTQMLRSFNFLELNVGMAIAGLENPSDRKASYARLAGISAER